MKAPYYDCCKLSHLPTHYACIGQIVYVSTFLYVLIMFYIL